MVVAGASLLLLRFKVPIFSAVCLQQLVRLTYPYTTPHHYQKMLPIFSTRCAGLPFPGLRPRHLLSSLESETGTPHTLTHTERALQHWLTSLSLGLYFLFFFQYARERSWPPPYPPLFTIFRVQGLGWAALNAVLKNITAASLLSHNNR